MMQFIMNRALYLMVKMNDWLTIFKPCDIYAYIQFYTVCRKSGARIKKTYIPNQSRPGGVIEFMIITETDSLYRI